MNPVVIIANVIGVIATTTFLLSYQQKKRMHIIIWNATARILFVFQYLMLGAYAGAVLDIVSAAVAALAGKKDHPRVAKHLVPLLILCNLALVGTGVATIIIQKEPLGILALVGVLLHTDALWLRDERVIRRISLCGSPCWFAYNLLSGAFGSAVGDLLSICSILLAMFKYRKKKEPQETIQRGS